MVLPAWWCVAVVCAGWWGSNQEVEIPVVALPVAYDGTMFSEWPSEQDGWPVDAAPECDWWNGTYYYDITFCSHMSVTRMPAMYAQQALARATRCAVHGATDCVLSGEIGLNMPAAFVWDESHGMRMVLAPKLVEVPGAERKTVRLQDPEGEHPNQLFDFHGEVRIEHLKAATRTMETLELQGNDAYCLQALRRAVVPTCWESLD